jgi:hypothetical protein
MTALLFVVLCYCFRAGIRRYGESVIAIDLVDGMRRSAA